MKILVEAARCWVDFPVQGLAGWLECQELEHTGCLAALPREEHCTAMKPGQRAVARRSVPQERLPRSAVRMDCWQKVAARTTVPVVTGVMLLLQVPRQP
jgi:hypothetical protein